MFLLYIAFFPPQLHLNSRVHTTDQLGRRFCVILFIVHVHSGKCQHWELGLLLSLCIDVG